MDEADPRQEALARIERKLDQHFEYNGQPNGPPVELAAIPFATWRRLPRPPREELLGPLVVKGARLVLGAETGAGKSTLVWWIVKALATGGSFLGWKASRSCPVLVVDVEQSDHDLERLMDETHLGDSTQCDLVHSPDGLALNESQEERLKLELIIRQGQYDVVVLDPLYKLHTGDSNDERQAVALMRLFDRWRTEYGFALLLPSHMRKRQGRKNDKDFSMDDIFGASAFLRGAEVVIGLRLLQGGQSQLFFFKSRSPGLPVRTSWMLRFDRYLGFSISESSTERASREKAEATQKVRELLEKAGGRGVTLQELMEETGKGRTAVFDMIKEIGAGSARMPGHGHTKLYLAPGVSLEQTDIVLDDADLDILEDDDND